MIRRVHCCIRLLIVSSTSYRIEISVGVIM